MFFILSSTPVLAFSIDVVFILSIRVHWKAQVRRRIKNIPFDIKYRQVSDISCNKSPKLKCFSSRLAVVIAQSIEARCQVENEDVVGGAPKVYAPTTSEWPTILLPSKVRLILEVWWYLWTQRARFGPPQVVDRSRWDKCVQYVASMC